MHYRIKRTTEEFGCPNCGSPSYVGDTAFLSNNGVPFCSKACSEEDSGRRAAAKRAAKGARGREPSPGWYATEACAASGQ